MRADVRRPAQLRACAGAWLASVLCVPGFVLAREVCTEIFVPPDNVEEVCVEPDNCDLFGSGPEAELCAVICNEARFENGPGCRAPEPDPGPPPCRASEETLPDGTCVPLMAQGDPPKPRPAPSTPPFGGVTTANFDRKVDELKGLAGKIKELANPKDPKKDNLNGLLIARLFVGGTPIEFAPKFGASETMVIRFVGFATADPNDPLAKLLLRALDCKTADASCVQAQVRQLDDRRSEIEKTKLQAQALSSNLVQCADSGSCTATKEQRGRIKAVFDDFDQTGLPALLSLVDEAQKRGGRLDGASECELKSDALSFNSCRNPPENSQAREDAERAKEREKMEKGKRPGPI